MSNHSRFVQPMVYRPRRRSGFTLIELLVVISIIALLIAMLLPTLGQSRKTARSLECTVRLRVIGGAQAYYLSDFKERYVACKYYSSAPLTILGVNAVSSGVWWDYVLYSKGYYGDQPASSSTSPANTKLWQIHNSCPEIGYNITPLIQPNTAGGAVVKAVNSYGWNYTTFDYTCIDTPRITVPKLMKPWNVMLAADAFRPVYDAGGVGVEYQDGPDANFILTGGSGGYSAAGYNVSGPANRHPGGVANMVFADQHVSIHKYVYHSDVSPARYFDASNMGSGSDSTLYYANKAKLTPTIP